MYFYCQVQYLQQIKAEQSKIDLPALLGMAASSLAVSFVAPCGLLDCLAPSGAIVCQALPCADDNAALPHVHLADI
jgi:hypothetical protein